MMDEISIDRLILDIPGLDAAQARDLAQHIGAGLAASPLRTGDTDFGSLSINLNHPASISSVPRLAEAIVRALLTQMGGH